jgi:hypothetical protein
MRLTFNNAMLYNPTGTDVNKMAKKLAKFFEKRWSVFSATGTYDRSMSRARGGGVAVSRRGAGRLTVAERRNFTEQVARLEYDDAVRIAAIVRQRMPELEVDSIDANHVLISVAKLRASVVRECLRVMAQMRSGTLQLAVPGASIAAISATTTAAAASTPPPSATTGQAQV